MNTMKFTLPSGLVPAILKASVCLHAAASLKEITAYITDHSLIVPCDGDLEIIDFVGKQRLECAVEACVYSLVDQGMMLHSCNGFAISASGNERVSSDWGRFSHEEFIKQVTLTHENRWTYCSIPPYLLYNGHKRLPVRSFVGHQKDSLRLLNDFVDYVDLNYPLTDEMIGFLKNNYGFGDDGDCLNAISLLRSFGLVKMIGKNLSLTKLGQWYINSYSQISMFKIMAIQFQGFEEIFKHIALKKRLKVRKLQEDLVKSYPFEWAASSHFIERMNWLVNLKIVKVSRDRVSLGDAAEGLVEYLGYRELRDSGRQMLSARDPLT